MANIHKDDKNVNIKAALLNLSASWQNMTKIHVFWITSLDIFQLGGAKTEKATTTMPSCHGWRDILWQQLIIYVQQTTWSVLSEETQEHLIQLYLYSIVCWCWPLNEQQWPETRPLTGGTLEQDRAHMSRDPPAFGQQGKGGSGGVVETKKRHTVYVTNVLNWGCRTKTAGVSVSCMSQYQNNVHAVNIHNCSCDFTLKTSINHSEEIITNVCQAILIGNDAVRWSRPGGGDTVRSAAHTGNRNKRSLWRGERIRIKVAPIRRSQLSVRFTVRVPFLRAII